MYIEIQCILGNILEDQTFLSGGAAAQLCSVIAPSAHLLGSALVRMSEVSWQRGPGSGGDPHVYIQGPPHSVDAPSRLGNISDFQI